MGILFSLLLMLILAVGGFGYFATSDLPPVEVLLAEKEKRPVQRSSQIFAADGHTVILSNGRFKQEELNLLDISPHMVDALLATEDKRFFSHHGIDPVGVARALLTNLRHKGVSEGGSTITMQLARNLFLSNERSFKRKLREMVLAYQLEEVMSKQQILETYLNTIYFGEGAYGIEAASQVYFSKPARQLTVVESAFLAGLPQAPSRYSPFVNPDLALNRRNEVLDKLVEAEKLTADEAKSLKSQGLGIRAASKRLTQGDKVPYFNRLVQQQLIQWFGLSEQEFWQSGFQVYTTLDMNAQALAEAAVSRVSQQFKRVSAGQEVGLVALKNGTGAILAYVGGRSFATSQYDNVSLARRSPGSLFKVFTYSAALEKGYLPTDVEVDEPVNFGSWSPKNYDKRHYGAMSLAQAFAFSNNVIAVKVLYKVGPEAVVELAQRMGVESPLKPYLALTLGGSGVTLMEMAGAFQAIVNSGVYSKPYGIEKVMDSRGELVYQHDAEKRDALAPTASQTMLRMMQDVVRYGTGTRARLPRPVAGKTGTSDDYRDAWFVGFTPDVTAGVWVGNTNNTPMPKSISGGTMPTQVWHQFMLGYASTFPLRDFDLSHSRTLNSDGGSEGSAPAAGYNGSLGAPPSLQGAPEDSGWGNNLPVTPPEQELNNGGDVRFRGNAFTPEGRGGQDDGALPPLENGSSAERLPLSPAVPVPNAMRQPMPPPIPTKDPNTDPNTRPMAPPVPGGGA